MIKYQAFVADVAHRAGTSDNHAARAAAESVLSTVGLALEPDQRRELGADLPSTLREALEVPGHREPELTDSRDVVLQVSERLHESSERARYLSQAVLSALRSAEPDTGHALADALGPRFADLFDAPGDGPPPERAGSAAMPGTPTQLTAEEVKAALSRLPAWSGDTSRLVRTVTLPADRHEPLIHRIQRQERLLNHRTHLRSNGDDLVIELRTHGSGDVTDLDVKLAERIDAEVAQFGSGGRPT